MHSGRSSRAQHYLGEEKLEKTEVIVLLHQQPWSTGQAIGLNVERDGRKT